MSELVNSIGSKGRGKTNMQKMISSYQGRS